MQIVPVEISQECKQSIFCEMCQQSTHVLMNAVFSIIHFLHRYCVQTVFLSYFSIDMSETSHNVSGA